jgi:hypothetical protein
MRSGRVVRAMGLKVSTNGSTAFAPAPEGVHRAVCISVIDLGTQNDVTYNKEKRKILLQWELVDEAMDDGRPFIVSRRYNLSLFESSDLRKDLERWLSKKFKEDDDFDVAELLGRPCQIQIIHNKKGYADVSAVLPLGKGTIAPETSNSLTFYAIDGSGCDLSDLSERVQETIKKAKEMRDRFPQPNALAGPTSDDVPF